MKVPPDPGRSGTFREPGGDHGQICLEERVGFHSCSVTDQIVFGNPIFCHFRGANAAACCGAGGAEDAPRRMGRCSHAAQGMFPAAKNWAEDSESLSPFLPGAT